MKMVNTISHKDNKTANDNIELEWLKAVKTKKNSSFAETCGAFFLLCHPKRSSFICGCRRIACDPL